MRKRFSLIGLVAVTALGIGGWLLFQRTALAHCDTMDGPVVKAATVALAKGNVNPTLRWVKPEQEAEVRTAFRDTLAVRARSSEAKAFADRYFFETLVRLHRVGEGEPYTGLKPAGSEIEPSVQAADKSFETGSVDSLAKQVAQKAEAGIRRRFADAVAKRKRADESVEAGREYVESYVEFVHYVERLDLDAAGKATHHGLH